MTTTNNSLLVHKAYISILNITLNILIDWFEIILPITNITCCLISCIHDFIMNDIIPYSYKTYLLWRALKKSGALKI